MEQNQKMRILSDRDQAREKISIFYGDASTGYLVALTEVLNNSIDEITNNFENGLIEVELSDDGRTVRISDSGRGIPVSEVDEEGNQYYKLVFEVLFSGSKYDISETETSGTNGVGLSILQYSSEKLTANINYKGRKYRVDYNSGGLECSGLIDLGATDKHGSEIIYKLDTSVYTNYVYTIEEVRDKIIHLASSSDKVTFKLIHKGKEELYHYENIKEYYDEFYDSRIKITGDEKRFVDGKEKNRISGIIGFNNGEVKQETYLNNNYLKEGFTGTIHEGAVEGIKQFVNKYAKDNALYKNKEKGITNKDIADSVSFYIKVNGNIVSYTNQTKHSTKKPLYKDITKKYVKDLLEVYSIENKDKFIEFVNLILISKRATEKANITRNSIRKELEKRVNNTAKDRIAKFIPCRETRPEETELYLVEGDSAAGAVAKARNKINQCLYPLKGKVLNVSKKTIDEILKNKEILDIFKILGCGMTHNGKNVKGIPVFNMDNLNMHKICILSDEDVDGSHIASLIVNMFFVLAPMLIEKGMVYRCLSPLYKITTTKDEKVYYAYDEEEKNKITRELSDKKIKYNTKYYKGLGGFDAEELAETTMDKDNRRMIQVTMQDVANAKEMLEIYFRDDTINKRKDFILENGATYFNPHNI